MPILPVTFSVRAGGRGPGTGTLSIPATMPVIPGGGSFTMQGFFFDPIASINVSATNGLLVNVG